MSSQTTPEVEILKEILKWTKFSGMKEVKTTLENVLETDQKKLAYHLSDGTRTTREVAGLAGFSSKTTIADMWKVWYRVALGETVSVQGGGNRFKRSFDLADFGILVPKSKPGISTGTPEGEVKDDGEE